MISMYRKFNVKLVAPIYFEQIKLCERYPFNMHYMQCQNPIHNYIYAQYIMYL